jgi:hypothetical protein
MREMRNTYSPRAVVGKPQGKRPRSGHSSRRYVNTKSDTGSVRSGFRWLRIASRGENDKSVIRDGIL